MADSVADGTRPPTKKQARALEGRLQRLDQPGHIGRIQGLYWRMPGKLPPTGLRIRDSFVYRQDVDEDSSDRAAPPRALRPPATRLTSSRGSTLVFALLLLALAQMNRIPGARARLKGLGIDVSGSSKDLGWSDLVPAEPADSYGRDVFVTARNKRARSVRSALAALEKAGLIQIPSDPGTRNRFSGFVLLNEGGIDAVGEAEEYRVPKRGDAFFTLPSELITNGWLHHLEDSEIALLMMVACRKGGWIENGLVAMPADTRLRNYGIHRDPYSNARKTLEWLGLLNVEEIGRHRDGRAENTELHVHRLALLPSGFDTPAVPALREAFERQLVRARIYDRDAEKTIEERYSK